MKCPKCKKDRDIEPIPNAAYFLMGKKLKAIPGWICMMCSLAWILDPSRVDK